MCYLFGRATKSVSIFPPAYYADIVCERARCYLGGTFDIQCPGQVLPVGADRYYLPCSTCPDPYRGNPAPSEAAEGGQRTEDVLIHPNLRNTMFYI